MVLSFMPISRLYDGRMIVVMGLGNPGASYEHTRHNVGFDAVDKAAAFLQVKLRKRCFRLYREAKVFGNCAGPSLETPSTKSKVIVQKASLVEPLTYMNASGDIVRFFDKASDFVVVCDHMDLAEGGLRIRKGGGASGQKGLDSISQQLGRSDFLRIYIGIGRPVDGCAVVDHVLGHEPEGERKDAMEKAIDDAAMAIVKYIGGASVEELQHEYNRKGLL